MDKTLDELMNEIKFSLMEKEKAEHARVRAEEKKRKAHYQYTLLMDVFRNKEYIII